MSGYTPLFSTLTTGTLCGRWPDIGLWPIVLSLADRHGTVDCTQAYISGVTGLPVEDVGACMKRFCEPDPGSRSNVEAGARLMLLDEHRDWGWRVINHGLYREKARLESKNAREIASGRNAERMGHRRTPETAADRRIPPLTDPSKLQTPNSEKKKNAGTEAVPLVLHASLPKESWEEWLAHRREKHLSMSPRALAKQLKLLAEYPTEIQREVIDTSINAGWEGLFRPKGNGKLAAKVSEWM